jgi:crooked neck
MNNSHKNYDRAREVYERFIKCHLEVKSYLKYAKFEAKYGTRDGARKIFERALNELGDDAQDEELFIAFADFEVYAKEYERARVLYKYALDHIPKHKAKELYTRYTSFEKQFGDRTALEDVILSKRRFQYEEELKENARNYDVWWDYTRLEEDRGEPQRVREVYERAIGAVPPIADKRYYIIHHLTIISLCYYGRALDVLI